MSFRPIKPVTDIWETCAIFYFLQAGMRRYRLRDWESPPSAVLLADLFPIRGRNPML